MRFDLRASGSQGASAIPVGEDLKDWDGVGQGRKEGVAVKVCAEIRPDVPGTIVGRASPCIDASEGNLFDSAKFIEQSRLFGGVTSIQKGCTGKCAFICWRKVSSKRLNKREQQSASWLVMPGV